MLAEDGDGNYNHSDHVLLLLQLGSELSDSVRGNYTLKTWLQLLSPLPGPLGRCS